MSVKEFRRVDEQRISGEIVDLEEAYVRNTPVSWLLLVPVLILAGIGKLPLLLLSLVRRGGTAGGGPGLKGLRRGPGVAVTPLWIRDTDTDAEAGGVEVELHGYVLSDRVMRGDRVHAELRSQARPDLPPRAVRIHNFTTGRMVAPHPDTLWSHLGLGLILQAFLGLAIVGLVTAAAVFD